MEPSTTQDIQACRFEGDTMNLTDETIYATRQWYADNAVACIDEAVSGRVRVNDLDKYIIEQTGKVGEYLTGKWDHTLAFQQMAVVIQTGECHPILPKWTEK